MDTIFFPGNEVLNLFPHWVSENDFEVKDRVLIPLNAHGVVTHSNLDNDSVTIQWEIPTQRGIEYTVETERDKYTIELIG